MSALSKLLEAAESETNRVRRGPGNQCHPLYGDGDLDTLRVIANRRAAGETWKQVQRALDGALKVEKPINGDKFRYHWNRRCFCWTDEQREAEL